MSRSRDTGRRCDGHVRELSGSDRRHGLFISWRRRNHYAISLQPWPDRPRCAGGDASGRATIRPEPVNERFGLLSPIDKAVDRCMVGTRDTKGLKRSCILFMVRSRGLMQNGSSDPDSSCGWLYRCQCQSCAWKHRPPLHRVHQPSRLNHPVSERDIEPRIRLFRE